jgi:6-phosphogluconate dehydrogenase
MLSSIQKALEENPPLLFAAREFATKIKEGTKKARQMIQEACAFCVPVPVLAGALTYIDSWVSATLPANLLQAQRDFFGAHTYRRIDRPGTFHTVWEGEE